MIVKGKHDTDAYHDAIVAEVERRRVADEKAAEGVAAACVLLAEGSLHAAVAALLAAAGPEETQP